MKFKLLGKGVLAVAMIFAVPAFLPAFPLMRYMSPSSSRFRSWFSPPNTTSRLEEIRSDALAVQNASGQLQALMRSPGLNDWWYDSYYLMIIRAKVNQMNRMIYQLRNDKAESSFWQYQAVERIAPTTVDMADTTQAAILTLYHNQDRVWFTDLGGLTKDIHNQASVVSHMIGNFEKYGTARQEARLLRKTLDLKGNA